MSNNRCILHFMRYIHLLQMNSSNKQIFNSFCDKNYLGPILPNYNFNTRVISIYDKNGNLFHSSYISNNIILESQFFRIMSFSDYYCTLLILQNDNGNFSSTNQFITVDISSIAAIRCIQDIFISNL